MHSILHAFTHSVVWASVIASAFVAAAVTVFIEYIAKPGLEARKDRILENKRELRTGVKDIRASIHLARRLQGFITKGLEELIADTGGEQVSVEYVNKIKIELSEHVTNAYQVLYPPKSVVAEWEMAIVMGESIALIFSREIPPETMEDYLDPVLERLELFYDYFGTQRLHLWRRHRLVKMIKETTLDEEALLAYGEYARSLRDNGGSAAETD
jgi:hypothetical protein